MKNFSFSGLSLPLIQSLERLKFNTPTPIQTESIPLALEGKDILGSAQTGTGKTGAFGIPLINKLMLEPNSAALVMTPTRELATQVMQALKSFMGHKSNIHSALLIGGEPMPRQLQQLRNNPRLIVGTPGRINDHLMRRNLKLHKTNFLVLDETDRMLDIGFTEQIEKIIKHLPEQRQTLLFSATLPKNIVSMANKYMNNPVRVSVGSTSKPLEKIKQEILRVSDADKYIHLLGELDKRDGSIIIFVKTKRSADKMAIKLRGENHAAEAIHGDLRQNKRDKVIRNFRNKKHRILVATDVAARGLDIPHIEHVINYDLPQCPEDYIHRIGRTARGDAEGSALCFLSPADGKKWNAINRLINPDARQESHSNKSSKGKYSAKPFRFKKNRNGSGKPQGKNSEKPQNRQSRRNRSNNGSGNNGGQGGQGGGKRAA